MRMLGVGVIGAGPGVEALHLPTLARLGDLFRVVHVADGGSGRAVPIAAAAGATASTGHAALLADGMVDVVAICSPPERHAEQILASVAAGARGILCEKPLALTHDDAEAVIAACREAGTALVVGTNHHFDPAWERARQHLLASGGQVRAVTVTASLPPNDRYHDVVTERVEQPDGPSRGMPDWGNPHIAAVIIRQLVLGLAVHDLPLVRDLAPAEPEVLFARPVPPIGYSLGFVAGDVVVQLVAAMVAGGADAMWRLSVATERDRLDVEFPPSFVHAGSAEVTVRAPDGRITAYPRAASDGYVEEWRALARLIAGDEPTEYGELLDDAHRAIELADAAAEAVRAGAGR